MYLKYYGMREHPFGVTPNPHYLYLSPAHREALASLIYGLEAWRGFMALIAKPGMGKTTLLFKLLERLGNSARTAFLFQTQCDSREFFHYLLSDMGIDSKGQDLARMHDQLNGVLLAEARAGRRFVLIIDEAQNLADSVLETVRLLSDFETPRAKLMQIILAGQPQLAEKLALPHLVQLRQRISLLARLEAFSQEETQAYVDHRLKVAGYAGPPLFTSEAMEIIAARSKGIPRDINTICFNAVSLGFALQSKKIDSAMVNEVLADLNLSTLIEKTSDVPMTPAAQQPIHRNVQPPVQGLARSGRRVADAAYRPKAFADGGRPALRVGALAATVFVTICFLAFLLEKGRIDDHLPLAQTVSASNSTRPTPTVPKGLRTDDLSSASAEPAGRKPPAQGTQAVPQPLPFVQRAATRRDSKSDGVRPLVGVGKSPARKVTEARRENPVDRRQLEKEITPHKQTVGPLHVRTVLPDVSIIQPELSYSLRPPDEGLSGPDSGVGTATVHGPASVKRVRVGSQAQAAKLLFQPEPEYPALAKDARVQGTVRLEVVVAKHGTVEQLRVLSGHPLLVEAAEAAVERWRYQPTVLNGSPIEVVTEVDVDFAF